MESEDVFADQHCQGHRDDRGRHAPEQQAKAKLLKSGDEAGPCESPTTAMNTFRPIEFMNHTVDDEIRPNVGRTERNQPKKRPEINAPPEVPRVSGTLPML